MAFDHGAPTIVPANFAMIVALSIIWWPIAPWWVILPPAIILAYLTMDPYAGMAIGHVILICALIISIPLAAKLGDSAVGAHPETSVTLIITGILSFIGLVGAIFGLIAFIGWLFDRKYTLRPGKKVKIIWGAKTGKKGCVEQLDPDGLTANIRLNDSGDMVRYPSNVFFEQPNWWEGRQKKLPQGTKIKVTYGKYENCMGTVLEYNTGTHVICVKLDGIADRLWYASNLVEPEKSL